MMSEDNGNRKTMEDGEIEKEVSEKVRMKNKKKCYILMLNVKNEMNYGRIKKIEKKRRKIQNDEQIN